jgi:hypothetical protein
MEQAIALIKSYLEKNLGVQLYQLYGIDYFKNSKSKGEGLRYILPDLRQIRFNFDNNQISSVDIWKADNKDPIINIETKDVSVVKILPMIVDQLSNPHTGTFDVPQEELVTTEAVKTKPATKIKVTPAGKNEVDNDPSIPPIQKNFDQMKYADVEYVFKDLDALVDLIAKGQSYSLLITGLPGTGKTYSTTKKLDEYGQEGKFYIHMQGITTPLGLFRILYENNGKVIVFDDCDRVLKEEDSIAILKIALDNKEERKVTWASKNTFNPEGMPQEQIDALVADGKLPNKFTFTGRVIFITNLYQDKVDKALKSRSYHIDITLKRSDILARIRQIMDQIQPNIMRQYKEELLNFIEKNIDKMKSDIDIRKFDLALKVIASGTKDWPRLVSNYI